MPFSIGPGELILILVIALLVVGPGRLPDVGAALGNSIREFRKAASDVHEAATISPQAASVSSATTAATPASQVALARVVPVQAEAPATRTPLEPHGSA